MVVLEDHIVVVAEFLQNVVVINLVVEDNMLQGLKVYPIIKIIVVVVLGVEVVLL